MRSDYKDDRNYEDRFSNFDDSDKLFLQEFLENKKNLDSTLNCKEALIYVWFSKYGLRDQTQLSLEEILSYWPASELQQCKGQTTPFDLFIEQCMKLMDNAVFDLKNK